MNVIQDCAVIAHSLTNVFNRSIQTGIFPDDFNLACISPIFKNGSKYDRNNYGPISVLSVVAKVFEKLISKQLSTYFESNKLLSKSQLGFRKNNSTETSLLNITNTWYINKDKGME